MTSVLFWFSFLIMVDNQVADSSDSETQLLYHSCTKGKYWVLSWAPFSTTSIHLYHLGHPTWPQLIHLTAKLKQSNPGTKMGQKRGTKGVATVSVWSLLLDNSVLTVQKCSSFAEARDKLSQMCCNFFFLRFFFDADHFLKSLLNLLQYCFCVMFFGFLATRHVGS